jgi:hypothetical protein
VKTEAEIRVVTPEAQILGQQMLKEMRKNSPLELLERAKHC